LVNQLNSYNEANQQPYTGLNRMHSVLLIWLRETYLKQI